MRYIDTGSRNSKEALGSWLADTIGTGNVKELRIQSGYIGSEPLGYLEEVLQELSLRDGATSILIGSNGGVTTPETVEDLIRLGGPPRSNLKLGVIAFSDGLFHPKVYHVVRPDNSMTAYVGSANFTYPGVSGKNIEAGIVVDTKDGDSPMVLSDISLAIDRWFRVLPPGLHVIRTAADISRLVNDGVLGATRAHPITIGTRTSGRRASRVQRLAALVRLPAISKPMATPTAATSVGPVSGPAVAPHFVDSWSKVLPTSDAQRKLDGNQSGVVALTQASLRGQIDHTKYFRNDLFGQLVWQQEPTRTGHMMDVAQVPMHTTVLGSYLGILTFEVSHDNRRESQQSNYTAKLSLRPIRAHFDQVDMTKRTLTIGRDAGGEYWLEIT